MLKQLALTLALTSVTLSANAGLEGIASWYGPGFHGKKTASGQVFNQNAMTCASNKHKMGTKLKVTNPSNGKSVVVTVNDTGGFGKYGRALDLSKGAFARIADPGKGTVKVRYQVVD